jgi:CMP-N-acetylneuraminic acid synthetase
MYGEKKVLAIIPARGGSKGLPWKNIKCLAGKPLIAWTIGHAKKNKYIDDVVVSTDSKKIASIAEEYGASVPFLRPASLATDNAFSTDVVLDLLARLKKNGGYTADFVILLQPTSPLRTSDDIGKAMEMLGSNKKADAVVSITEVVENPYWMKVQNDKGFIGNFIKHGRKIERRQDLPVIYTTNGAIYACKTSVFLKSKTFFPKHTLGYVMPRERSIDIDDIADFKMAELIITGKI